jgi:hypothetical protein
MVQLSDRVMAAAPPTSPCGPLNQPSQSQDVLYLEHFHKRRMLKCGGSYAEVVSMAQRYNITLASK